LTTPAPHGWYIRDSDSFATLCRQLRGAHRIGLDTEFIGEDRFTPRLELIQVAVGNTCAVVDVPALGTLDGLGEILADPKIEKIFHAGRQDLDLLAAHTGQIPAPFFDTQVAASMVGYGMQVAYSQLVQKVTGQKLEKAHTFTNWSQRPLTPDQLAYAFEDVQFLFPIHDHLVKRLKSLGRMEWVQEEFARLQTLVGTAARDPHERYQRIRGWDNLKPQNAAILRELAAWRDEEAQRRNVPRGRVIRDEVLVELARRPPHTVEAMKGVRGLHGGEVEKRGEAILATIPLGLAVPPSEWPETAPPKRPEPESAGQVDLLQAVLKARATEEHIAPTLLATSSDLQELVEAKHEREKLDLPILNGWRRKLAGELLLQVLTGNVSVSVDHKSGKLKVSHHS
jgi:ribonuclease D